MVNDIEDESEKVTQMILFFFYSALEKKSGKKKYSINERQRSGARLSQNNPS